MASNDRPESKVRRKILKATAVAAGSVAAGTVPWSRPEMKSFFGVRSAWAVPTFALTQTAQGQLGVGIPGGVEDTGQDRWQFLVHRPDTQVTITVSSDDGFSDLELFLYRCADVSGSALGLTNLLTGTPFGLDQNGVGGAESATIVLAPSSPPTPLPICYLLGIEDARTPGNEVAGQYSILLEADKEIGCLEFVGDEEPESDQPEGG